MENKNLPAFASVAISGENGYQQEGLTKREYFAGLALQGMLAQKDINDRYKPNIIENAVEFADLLLEQLEKQP